MTDSSQHEDPYADPAWIEYARHAREELVPMISASAFTISLAPGGEPDIKFALETGLSIMLDKPIIVVKAPGDTIPKGLEKVAVKVIEADLADPRTAPVLSAAINELVDRLDQGEEEPPTTLAATEELDRLRRIEAELHELLAEYEPSGILSASRVRQVLR